MPRNAQEALKDSETNTLPWSTTIAWGMMTGRAAACSRRSSMLSIRRNGRADADIFMASGQPGRTGSGVTVRASSTLASTDLVVGRSTAAVTVLVATSMIPVRSTRSGTPLSRRTRTSGGVESICIRSPGAVTGTCPNGPSGRAASDRRVFAGPVACRPASRRSNRR